MSQYLTLKKSSPDFKSYLNGTFSKEYRALAVHSLNINSEQEKVTFQIVPVHEIQKPSWPVILGKTIRPRSLLAILFPMFFILSKNIQDGVAIDPWSLLLSTLGVISLFISFNLRNDYIDHMKGFDRVDPLLENRPIQLGWLTANSVRKAGNIFLALAVLLAFPVFIAVPNVGLYIAAAGIVGFLSLFRLKLSFKEFTGGELGLFLLTGPLLATGYELSFTGKVAWETLLFGFIWGGMSLLPYHLRNLSTILSQSQAGLSNMVNYFGFDKAKKFIYYWWFLSVVAFIYYHFKYAGFFWFWFFSCIMIVLSMRFSYQLLQLSTPMGSAIEGIRKKGSYLLIMTVAIWTVEVLWQFFL